MGEFKSFKGPLSTPGPEVDALFMVQSHLFRSDYDLFHNHVILHNNKFLGPPPPYGLVPPSACNLLPELIIVRPTHF